jgi:hypothetical protein
MYWTLMIMFWHVQEIFQFYRGIGLEDREVSAHINVMNLALSWASLSAPRDIFMHMLQFDEGHLLTFVWRRETESELVP